MKYLKEVCDECGAVQESEIHRPGTTEASMKGFSVAINNRLHSDNIIGDKIGKTNDNLCPECYEKAESELEDFINRSKYFKSTTVGLF